ncbi:hypothetical protein JHK85_013683 [Glycine max]|nr:hypothetical protein JHK85_013683 [Glycine max]
METKPSSVMVTLSYGALTCAAEVLATLLASAVVKATLLAPDLYRLLLTNTPTTKGERKTQSQDKQRDAEGEDGNDDEGDDDDDGDGGFGEGEEELSSEDGVLAILEISSLTRHGLGLWGSIFMSLRRALYSADTSGLFGPDC